MAVAPPVTKVCEWCGAPRPEANVRFCSRRCLVAWGQQMHDRESIAATWSAGAAALARIEAMEARRNTSYLRAPTAAERAELMKPLPCCSRKCCT